MDIKVPRTQLVFHAEEQTFLVQKTISYTGFFLDNKVSGWGGWEREGLAGRQTLAFGFGLPSTLQVLPDVPFSFLNDQNVLHQAFGFPVGFPTRKNDTFLHDHERFAAKFLST